MRLHALLTLLACCACSVVAGPPWLGGSVRDMPSDYVTMAALGATAGRVYAPWAYIQPRVSSVNSSLTVSAVQANPSMVGEWAAAQNWAVVDERVNSMLGTGVTTLILEIGEGTSDSLPQLNQTYVDPNVVGTDCYLGYMYLYGRATIERYCAHQALTLVQLENELNEAWLESIAGIRVFRFASNAWRDFDFLTQLLGVLKLAVLDGAAAAGCARPLVTTNLHTDVAEWVHTVLDLPGYFVQAATAWAPLLDVLAMDAYPSMLVAEPCQDGVIGARVAAIRSASGGSMPVLVMETSYPACGGSNCSVPFASSVNFTESNQASCAVAMLDATFAAGGSGFLWFVVSSTEGMIPPVGGYSAEDVAAMQMLATLYQDHEDPLIALEWLASPSHIEYLQTGRLAEILKAIGQGFGMTNSLTGQQRPVFEALQTAFARLRAHYQN